MGKQPALGKLPVFIYYLDGFRTDASSRTIKRRNLSFDQGAGSSLWIEPGAPQNFIRHPVTDSRKTFLHQQQALQR
jgi:hypothetical protein